MTNMCATTAKYDSTNLEVLTGLDPVKKRPGMYTDTTRPNHLAREAIDNSVDEAIAGFASEISVIHYKDGSLEIIDNGRGMPTDIHPEHKQSGVELILTRLHTGAKFSSKTYQFSGGLHGVGISVVNALSTKLVVTVKKGGEVHQMTFAAGEPTSKLKVIDKCPKSARGTSIHFYPDASYFDNGSFDLKAMQHTLRAKAVLCPGLTVNFKDEKSGNEQSWYYEDGLTDYLKSSLKEEETLPPEPFVGSHKTDDMQMDWAVCWLAEPSTIVINESYVNLIPTKQGGTHVNGLRSGLCEAFRDFCALHKLLPRGVKLAPEDVWENIQFVLSFKMHDPQFAGQTKERLSSRQCAAVMTSATKDALSLWLNKHFEQGKAIAEHMIARAQQRLKVANKVARKKVTQGPALPGKLADCSGHDLADSELFLVEGDSAGGSAKQARDRRFQAIMPLRGKILNTWEVSSERVLASQEVHDIAVALGIDPGSDDLSGLRYGKVCLLADADSDGAHIATLLCALFLRHFPTLVEAGHVFVAMPPLFRIDVGKEVFYALDDSEREHIINKLAKDKPKAKPNIQRFKGLGEMNPSQLRETTMHPDTRRLVQLTMDDAKQTCAVFDMMLNKKRASDRKIWLEDKGNLADVA
jgi:topoisomerase-4 subunit B